jgi:ElaB/YqjD/DUF883 family membrane-anchored ribosome-binding protein
MNQDIATDYSRAAASATDTASNALHRASDRAANLAQRGADALHRSADSLHRSSDELQLKARHLRHDATDYIHREPTKSLLIAAASGAALMVLLSMLARSRTPH